MSAIFNTLSLKVVVSTLASYSGRLRFDSVPGGRMWFSSSSPGKLGAVIQTTIYGDEIF
jgi:hypothetical protein